jgi:hypothetical protein
MGLRTGTEYLAGLRDSRQIIYDGRRIEDITTEPGFRHTARAVAQYYDFQHLPEVQDLVSYETPDGDRAHLSFIEPRCKEDLRRRAAAFAAWAEVTCGHMGRSPDYMNACLMAVGAARPHWGAKDPVLGKRAYEQYLDARRRDLCYTHTFVQAHTDRFKPATEQKSTLRVVRETAGGLVVAGAKAVGTLAPYADAGALAPSMVSRRAARGRRAGGWGDAAAARGEKRGFGILIRKTARYVLTWSSKIFVYTVISRVVGVSAPSRLLLQAVRSMLSTPIRHRIPTLLYPIAFGLLCPDVYPWHAPAAYGRGTPRKLPAARRSNRYEVCPRQRGLSLR